MVRPLTETMPEEMSSSACLLEAIPARAIIFCSLSSMESDVKATLQISMEQEIQRRSRRAQTRIFRRLGAVFCGTFAAGCDSGPDITGLACWIFGTGGVFAGRMRGRCDVSFDRIIGDASSGGFGGD